MEGMDEKMRLTPEAFGQMSMFPVLANIGIMTAKRYVERAIGDQESDTWPTFFNETEAWRWYEYARGQVDAYTVIATAMLGSEGEELRKCEKEIKNIHDSIIAAREKAYEVRRKKRER